MGRWSSSPAHMEREKVRQSIANTTSHSTHSPPITHDDSDTDEGPSVDEKVVPAPVDEKHNPTQDDSHQSVLDEKAFDLVLNKESNRLQTNKQVTNKYTNNIVVWW